MPAGRSSRTGPPRSARSCATTCRDWASRRMIRNQNLLSLAAVLLRLAEQGLTRRARLDRNGRDETRYLRPLQEIVARGITPAEELLEKLPTAPLEGSVEPIFDEYAY